MSTGAVPGARRMPVTRVRSSSKNTRISSRASDAPRQKWVPNPNARCGFGCRVMSKRSGSAKCAGSRLADGYISTACWPARIVSPPRSTSRVATRHMLLTGVT